MKFNFISKFSAIICVLILLSVVTVKAHEIIDERISLVPAADGTTAKQIFFAGQKALIKGTEIYSATGNGNNSPLFKSAEKILDVLPGEGGVDYVLTETSLMPVKAKKSVSMPLAGKFSDGKLLFAKPGFYVYFLKDADKTYFFTQNAANAVLYFAMEGDVVVARLDEDANTIIATGSKILSVNFNGVTTPLFDFGQPVIEGLEILSADNTLLVDTPSSLVKITAQGKPYTILSGRGTLGKTENKYLWFSADEQKQFEILGLELPGRADSDQAYARAVLEQSRKLLDLKMDEPAFKKLLHLLEIAPQDRELQETVLFLGNKLYGKK